MRLSLQRDEEIERLQQQLARVSGERDELREAAASSTAAAAAVAQHVNALAAAAATGRGGGPAGAGARDTATAAAGLQPPGGALPRLHSAGHGLRGMHRSTHALWQAGQQPPPAAPPPPASTPAVQHPPDGEGMVSAFACALPFSFE